MSKMGDTANGIVRLHLHLSQHEAECLAQAVKRINRSSLARDGLNISTNEELLGAEDAFRILGRALAQAGHDPR